MQPAETETDKSEDTRLNMNDRKYDDIIDLPNYKSKIRPRMSNSDRAAQFLPFAALTGHGAAIQETARTTKRKIELTDEEKEIVSAKLRFIREVYGYKTDVTITYFTPDSKKPGGAYVERNCRIAKIDEDERKIYVYGGEKISIEDVLTIEGDVFCGFCTSE